MRPWGMQNPPAEAVVCLPPPPPRFVHCAASTALRQGLRPVTVLVFAACALQRSGSGGSRQDADMDRGDTIPRYWTMGISNCRHGQI
jgi:hypothetical protein